jgi:hypothetical protein
MGLPWVNPAELSVVLCGSNFMPSKSSKRVRAEATTAKADAVSTPVVSDVVVSAPKPLTQVHRCRFIEYTPVGITALAVNGGGDGLVVARSDASLEYWTPVPPAGPGASPTANTWTMLTVRC